MTSTPEPTQTAAPVYANAPRPRNRLGLIALLLVIVAFLVPIGFLVGGIISIATDPNPPVGDNVGWAALGAAVFMLFGVAVSAPIAIGGIVIGIVSLTRKNVGKVLGIIAIILGTPYALVGLVLLPPALSLFFG